MSLVGRLDVTKNLRESKKCVFSFPDSARTSWKEAKNEAEEPGYHVHCPFPCLQNHSNKAWFVKTTKSRQSTTQGGCLPLSSICHLPWLCRLCWVLSHGIWKLSQRSSILLEGSLCSFLGFHLACQAQKHSRHRSRSEIPASHLPQLLSSEKMIKTSTSQFQLRDQLLPLLLTPTSFYLSSSLNWFATLWTNFLYNLL